MRHTQQELTYLEKRSNENRELMFNEGYNIKREPPKQELNRCPVCNNIFLSNSPIQIYCSNKCYKHAAKENRRHRNRFYG